MSAARREQVFWGWGEPGAGPRLPEHAAGWLRETLGVDGGVVSAPVPLAEVELPAPALADGVRARLAGIVGAANLRDDREARVLRAAGKSYLDLLAQRAGDCRHAPDAVVAPRTHHEVAAVLAACADAGVAVVPFGGGTSVVGGVAPERGPFDSVVSLDLGRMDAVVAVDERSLLVRMQPGLRLPEADFVLRPRGLTLGHHPQSYEWATVGGCVATRSSGQASTGFGRIDANVVAVRLAAPAGEVATREVPASAAGPSLRELLVGSEGVLGVLTEVALRVRPIAEDRRYEAWFVPGFEAGCEVLRELARSGATADVVRLSDEPETRMTVAVAGDGRLRDRLGTAVLRARGLSSGCLLVLGWEGDARRRRAEAARRLRRVGALAAGRPAGEAWRESRYGAPHLRDDLMDRGVLVETLETAATWSRLTPVVAAVRSALTAQVGGVVLCHVSHLYATGASLYFTVLARADPEDPAAQWRAAKAVATDALLDAGGTLTHHHGVGRDHALWLGVEDGALGVEALRAVKARLDPAGVMNPGKLLPDS